MTGAGDFTGGPFLDDQGNQRTGNWALDISGDTVTATPEPATFLLFPLAILAACFLRKDLTFMRSISCLLLLSLASIASAADVPLVGDATTRSTLPASNFGQLPQLEVSSSARSFLQFDLSTLPAGTTSANISNAILKLYVDKVISPGTVLIGSATGAWTEGTITDLTAPSAAGLTSAGVSSVNEFVTADVTAIVKQWLDAPSTNHGVVLSTQAGDFFFDSKESVSTSQPASLEIALVSMGPQGPKGDTGSQGPQGLQGPAGPNVLASGSAFDPALSFTASPHTGLFLPAADTFSIATAGQSRLSVGPTGNLDLGGNLTMGGIILAKIFGSVGSLSTSFGIGNLASSSGGGNAAFGAESMVNNTIGTKNTALGMQTLVQVKSGSDNTALGASALYNATGDANVAVGYAAGFNLTSGSNNVYVGNAGAVSESGAIRIGTAGTQTAAYLAGVQGVTPAGASPAPVVVDSNGQLGSGFSSVLARVRNDYSLAGNTLVALDTFCPASNPVLISGGCGHRDFNSAAADIVLDYSGPDPNGGQFWHCLISNNSSSSRAILGYVICTR